VIHNFSHHKSKQFYQKQTFQQLSLTFNPFLLDIRLLRLNSKLSEAFISLSVTNNSRVFWVFSNLQQFQGQSWIKGSTGMLLCNFFSQPTWHITTYPHCGISIQDDNNGKPHSLALALLRSMRPWICFWHQPIRIVKEKMKTITQSRNFYPHFHTAVLWDTSAGSLEFRPYTSVVVLPLEYRPGPSFRTDSGWLDLVEAHSRHRDRHGIAVHTGVSRNPSFGRKRFCTDISVRMTPDCRRAQIGRCFRNSRSANAPRSQQKTRNWSWCTGDNHTADCERMQLVRQSTLASSPVNFWCSCSIWYDSGHSRSSLQSQFLD